jgi:hypothetical protein
MKKLISLLVALFLVLFALGCSEDEESNPVNPSDPSLSGSWMGSGGILVIDMNLTQSGTSVSGSGTMQNVLACTISGTNNYPNVSLTFSVSGAQPTTFSGTFAHKDTLSGKLNGSGFTNYDMEFVRQ